MKEGIHWKRQLYTYKNEEGTKDSIYIKVYDRVYIFIYIIYIKVYNRVYIFIYITGTLFPGREMLKNENHKV